VALNELSTTENRRTGLILWSLVFAVFAIASMAVGFESAMHFAGVPLDGPFQLYNGVRRIGAGFRPGVDFQFFHGMGVPYLHYWLYRLFGGGLRGAELARELLATTLYPLTFLAIFGAFTRRWTLALALSATAMAASYLLHLSAMLFALSGMLSLRSALPTLLAIAMVWRLTCPRRIVAVGAVLGLALFISTEQGLAALLAFVCVSAVQVLRSRIRAIDALASAATIAVAVCVLILAELLVGGVAGARGALNYNFRIVPMDQYWFFGAPPNVFVASWSAAAQMVLHTPLVGFALLGAVTAILWYSRSFWRAAEESEARRAIALLYLSMYALVSCTSLLGVFLRLYVQPCWRVLLIIALLEAARIGARIDARQRWHEFLGMSRSLCAAAFAVCAITFATVAIVPSTVGATIPHIVRAHIFGDARFGVAGDWPEILRDYAKAVDAHRRPDGGPPTIWSTYAGWLEARNAVFHPSFDYIIQVLGPANREAYVNAFRSTRPDLVQTVRPSYTSYESWLENNDWAFYDELLMSYRVYSLTPWSIFWERREQPLPPPTLLGTITIPPGIDGVQIPEGIATSGPTLLEVEVEYETRNPFHVLPVIGASPRYLVAINGAMSRLPVSLDPFVAKSRFPLLVAPGQHPSLQFQAFSLLPGARIVPKVVRIFVRPLDSGAARWLSDVSSPSQRR